MFRGQGGSLQSIRKGLLETLNLQAEPQLPAGGLDGVREQWRNTFSTVAHRAKDTVGKWKPKFKETIVDPNFSQPLLILSGLFKAKCSQKCLFSMSFTFQPPLATLCHLMLQTVQAWSAVPWPLRSSWKVCNNVCVCTSMCMHIDMKRYSNACTLISILMFTRLGMGQLGDPSCQPYHRSVCTVQPWS